MSGKRLGFTPILCYTVCVSAFSLAPPQQASAPAEGSCGPPHYCARTDRQTVPYPAQPPALGPAGSIFTDPDFGSRIVRVTDSSTNPQTPGLSFHTPASAEQNSWNTTATAFFVGDSNGAFFLYDFNPSTMAVHAVGNPKLGWSGEEFSFSQANILYGIGGQTKNFEQYDLAARKSSTIHEISTCVSLKPNDSVSGISVSADDNRLITVIGPGQDHNYMIYAFDRKQGCRWYNTQTGEIGGKWGPTGTTAAPYRFSIHDARLSKSGKFAEIIGGGTGPIFWDIDSTNVTFCSNKELACLGHKAMGYSHLLNSPNRSHPLEFVVRPLGDLSAMRKLINPMPPLIGWYDYHVSWNYIDPQDDTPVCFSTYHPTNPNTPGTPLLVNGPWENEVDCVETDGKASTVWRFAHAYSTARNGFWSTPRGNVSQDGRFFMFTSDWEDQLGQEAKNPKQYRTDVFIVQLH